MVSGAGLELFRSFDTRLKIAEIRRSTTSRLQRATTGNQSTVVRRSRIWNAWKNLRGNAFNRSAGTVGLFIDVQNNSQGNPYIHATPRIQDTRRPTEKACSLNSR